ncbi:MAG TPA: AAA family ATPase [Micromonosporaceae bacterium]
MIRTLAVENYRSLRRLVVRLGRLTVVTGANGTGKSSLYRSLRLLAASASGGAVAALAAEGGLAATLWAGPETSLKSLRDGRPVQGTTRTEPVGLRLGFADEDFGYAMDLGLPVPSSTAFDRDPEYKREVVWAGEVLRPATVLCDRGGTTVRLRDADGGWASGHDTLRPFDSMLAELADPRRAPELMRLRERIRSWRFYDHFRTDADAPARMPRLGTRTPVLSHDGADLAAALQTIREIGDVDALDAAIEQAFPGSTVGIGTDGGRFDVRLRQHGLLRPLGAAELSDGTMRYLLLAAALLTPRPPALMVLNEPETSLHPDLIRPLASLIHTAARTTQIIVVTHSRPLALALDDGDASPIELVKEFGHTLVADQGVLDEPPWHWPKR